MIVTVGEPTFKGIVLGKQRVCDWEFWVFERLLDRSFLSQEQPSSPSVPRNRSLSFNYSLGHYWTSYGYILGFSFPWESARWLVQIPRTMTIASISFCVLWVLSFEIPYACTYITSCGQNPTRSTIPLLNQTLSLTRITTGPSNSLTTTIKRWRRKLILHYYPLKTLEGKIGANQKYLLPRWGPIIWLIFFNLYILSVLLPLPVPFGADDTNACK
jgi:hypothetical protein